ncbi:MAG: hypothetical protein LT080_08110 [Thiobacillus sp.]|nr:hypothetical protein [Thiobacillus sp.]
MPNEAPPRRKPLPTTSPSPTTGYIEVLLLADVVMTDWTMEEVMSFVMTGGTNAPENVRFNNPPRAAAEEQAK